MKDGGGELIRGSDSWKWVQFALWAAAGAAAAFVTLSVLGPAFGIAVAVAMVVLAATRRLNSSAFGLLLGVGALCLFVAWLNRLGPGTVETRTATSFSSETLMDPRPWLAAGLVLIAVSLVGFVGLSRRRSRASSEGPGPATP